MRFLSALTALLILLDCQESGSQPLASLRDQTTKPKTKTVNRSSPPQVTAEWKQGNDFGDDVTASSNNRLLSTMSWVVAANFSGLSEYGGNRFYLAGDGNFLAASNYYGSSFEVVVRFFQKQESDGEWEEMTNLRLFENSTDNIFGSDGGSTAAAAAGVTFGADVSLSEDGKRVAIGASRDDGANNDADSSGSVSVYEMMMDSDDGSEWSLMGVIVHGESGIDSSGSSVALSKDGSMVAVGSPFDYGSDTDSGTVKVYRWNGTSFNQLGEDINGEAGGDESGRSVALSEDGLVVAVGAPHNNGGGYRSGHVRVFYWDENENKWSQRGSDMDGDAENYNLGSSVDLSSDGNILAAGATGDSNDYGNHAKVFQWKQDNGEWEQIGQTLEGPTESYGFGESVSLSSSGSILAVGSYFYSSPSIPTMVYTLVDNQWEELADAVGSTPGRVSLSSDGRTVAVGYWKTGDSVTVFDLVNDSAEPTSNPITTMPTAAPPTPATSPTPAPTSGLTPAPSTTDNSNAGAAYSILCPWYMMVFAFVFLF
eukprot:scaffold3579_cov168-Cylindrotheca_fusiformis.AAC.8